MKQPAVNVIKRGKITKIFKFETLEELEALLKNEWEEIDGRLEVDDDYRAECIAYFTNIEYLRKIDDIADGYNEKIKQAKLDRGEIVGMTIDEAERKIRLAREEARKAWFNGEYTKYLIIPSLSVVDDILDNVMSQTTPELFEEEIDNIDYEIEQGLKPYTYDYIIKDLGLNKKNTMITVYKDTDEFVETKRADTEQRGVRAYTDLEIVRMLEDKDFIIELENGVILELAY